MPDDHPNDLRVGQAGFYLVNDGIAAHEISVDSFSIGSSMRAKGETLPRIGEKEKGFLLVWLDGFPPYAYNGEKWDLAASLAKAARGDQRVIAWQADYSIKVSLTYRDSRHVWYRSSAALIYVQSQMRLTFGPTTHERLEPDEEANNWHSATTDHGTSGTRESRGPCPVGGNFLPGNCGGAMAAENKVPPGQQPDTLELPDFTVASRRRVDLETSVAAVTLQEDLLNCWRQYFPTDVRIRSVRPDGFFPPFYRYGVAIYNANALELITEAKNYTTYESLLRFALKTFVCNRIAPCEATGDWQRFMLETWHLYDHPRHSELHRLAIEIVSAFDAASPV